MAPIARHPPTLRASLSANAVLSRPRHVADEHFLEQNPWANPQHPAHLHRQASALSRTVSPLATPALQRRSTETTAGLKSASTVADAQKAVYSSTASTPATGSQEKGLKMTRLGLDAAAEHQAQTSTPSRLLPPDTDNAASMPKSQHSGLQKSHVSAMISSEKAHPSSAGRNQAQEIHMKPYVPKVPRRVDSPSSMPTPKLPSSPSARFPIMRADDMPRLPGRSPTPQHYHRPVPVNITANGGSDR